MPENTALKSILLLASNPKGTPSLRLQEEEQQIKERLRLAGYGRTPVNAIPASRPRDIQQAMLDFKPQIVHFTGHGAGQDGLVFEDVTGNSKLVDSEALANLFRLFSKRVECVVLNACYSKFQAEAIGKYIKYVVGMSNAIGDSAAIEFSIGFYTALGAGESISFAYELGCNAIQLAGIPEHLSPALFKEAQLVQNRLSENKGVENEEKIKKISLELDILVAALQLEQLEVEDALEILAKKFEQSLPQRISVTRKNSLLSAKRSVKEITLHFDQYHYQIIRESTNAFKTKIMKVVRGIVIKTTEVPVDEWINQIASELIQLADQSEVVRISLQNFLI